VLQNVRLSVWLLYFGQKKQLVHEEKAILTRSHARSLLFCCSFQLFFHVTVQRYCDVRV
jgi:hypothetical protein